MPDKKKVIKGLECCTAPGRNCDMRCPYYDEDKCEVCLERDALNLLKEQEMVEPYMDYDGQDVWRCGKCGNSLMHPSYYESDEDVKNYIKYCSHCGKVVKWK